MTQRTRPKINETTVARMQRSGIRKQISSEMREGSGNAIRNQTGKSKAWRRSCRTFLAWVCSVLNATFRIRNFAAPRPRCGLAFLLMTGSALAAFDSGSNGSDGALNLTTPGVIELNPAAMGLDADGDNAFHFTTINIASGVTVRLTARYFSGPVYWLASGDVTIDGVIDLSGEDGMGAPTAPGDRIASVPGAGGYAGGLAAFAANPTSGLGPGGGSAGFLSAGCVTSAQDAAYAINIGQNKAYGNFYIVPLIGGSGGGGEVYGGGAGGGALLLASSASISINGSLQSKGGNEPAPAITCRFSGGGIGHVGGGAGSGGSIRLMAPVIKGSGAISAAGGLHNSSAATASHGRIRLEANTMQFTGTANPGATLGSPFSTFVVKPSIIRAVTVAGNPVVTSPTGSFVIPDVSINSAGPVTVDIEAENIPLGTVAKLYITSENGPDQTIDSTPLTGTLAASTATATVTLPPGFSRGFVRAVWTP